MVACVPSVFAGISLAINFVTGAEAVPRPIVAADVAAGDQFGTSVCVWRTDAVVGAPSDDERGFHAGAAYVLLRSCGDWGVEQKLLPESVGAGDRFGETVAIREDTIAVAAPGADQEAGLVYVFQLAGGDWTFVQTLSPDPSATASGFGSAIAIAGDRIVVGASGDDANATDAGAAYVFRFDGIGWQREAKLLADDADAFDLLGQAVAIEGDTIVVGSPFAFAVDSYAGAAYVFVRNGKAWEFGQKLMAADGRDGDGLGSSVALRNEHLLVGAPLDNGPRTDSGSAYAFAYDGAGWNLDAKLEAAVAGAHDRFGSAVALEGNRAFIGAPGDLDKSETQGSLTVYGFDGVDWVREPGLSTANGAPKDGFGWSVSAFGDRALIGAPLNDLGGDASGATYSDYFGPVETADFDADGDTDVTDFQNVASCLGGPGILAADPACQPSDLDGDDDVDLSDVAAFQLAAACGN